MTREYKRYDIYQYRGNDILVMIVKGGWFPIVIHGTRELCIVNPFAFAACYVRIGNLY